jgi:hypothetical protein
LGGLTSLLELPPVVEADHHHYEFWFLCCYQFADSLWPIGIFASGIAADLGSDQTGIGTMSPQYPDLG